MLTRNKNKNNNDKIKKCSAGNENTLVWRGFPQCDSLKRDNILEFQMEDCKPSLQPSNDCFLKANVFKTAVDLLPVFKGT